MSTAKLPVLPVDEAVAAGAQVGIPETKAGIALYRVLLNHPPLAQALSGLMEALSTEGEPDTRLRELMILRVGWLNGGAYEWTLHWFISLQLGIPEEELVAVRDWERHEYWSPAERAALRVTDEVVQDGQISSDSWEECDKLFPGARQKLELVAIVHQWKMISDLIQNLAIPLDEGFPAWAPDGVAPSA